MSKDEFAEILETTTDIVVRNTSISRATMTANRLPQEYRQLYQDLVTSALREFPPIEGYETMHALLVERMAWFFVMQKQDDAKSEVDVQWKSYRVNTQAFLRSIETLLKEAKTISNEVAFKSKVTQEVMEIVDRCVSSKAEKKLLVQELRKLAKRP